MTKKVEKNMYDGNSYMWLLGGSSHSWMRHIVPGAGERLLQISYYYFVTFYIFKTGLFTLKS